jgi:hypothetical protein
MGRGRRGDDRPPSGRAPGRPDRRRLVARSRRRAGRRRALGRRRRPGPAGRPGRRRHARPAPGRGPPAPGRHARAAHPPRRFLRPQPGGRGDRLRSRRGRGPAAVGRPPVAPPLAGGPRGRGCRGRRARRIQPAVPQIGRGRAPAHAVVRLGGGGGGGGDAGGPGRPPAVGLARQRRRRGPGRHAADPRRPHPGVLEAAHRPGRRPAGPHRVPRRPQRRGRLGVSGHRARSGPGAHRLRAAAARALDAGGGRGRPALPAGPRAAGPVRQPPGLRGAGGARPGAQDLRQPALPGRPPRRAAAPGRRVAA